MKEDLEKYQQLLKDANVKLNKAEQDLHHHLHLVSQNLTNLGLNTVLNITESKKTNGNKVSTALKFSDNTFFQPVRIDLVNKETNELIETIELA